MSDFLPVTQRRNHKGALAFPDAISKYLDIEKSYGAVIGPYASNPFASDIVLSPLNSVPKGLNDRRIILDLSWPESASVNDGIPAKQYLGVDFDLVYPTVDDIASTILNKGRGCFLFKRDLKRAYRQLPIDPGDYHFLGYEWNNQMYFDTVLPMGLRSAAMACQRVTSAVSYVCSSHDFSVCNYLDDFIGVDIPNRASYAYTFLGDLLSSLGLEESVQKAASPSTCMTVLGVQFDTVAMTMSVTPDRLRDLADILSQWMLKSVATKSQIQSLIGKLMFVSKCVKQSRIFLARILAVLRSVSHGNANTQVRLSTEFKKDLAWWRRFLPLYNGVSYIYNAPWSSPDAVFSTDACLSGCGGVCKGEFFHVEFPPLLLARELSINALEILAVVIACKLWGHMWTHRRILLYCDNQATVMVLNSGRTRCTFMADCLRELWLISAVNDFELRAVHLEGSANREADLLSRWHLDARNEKEFRAIHRVLPSTERTVPDSYFTFESAI